MVNHWNIRIFTVYIQKHVLINQVILNKKYIYLYINTLILYPFPCEKRI